MKKSLLFGLPFVIVFLLSAENIVFPQNSGIYDITEPPYSADNTGKTDVTNILQKAVNDLIHPGGQPIRIIYLPNGTYKVSGSITWHNTPTHGPRILGQNRKRTVIRLVDNCSMFQKQVRSTGVFNTGGGVAQNFSRAIRNLTIYTGKGNPWASGIQFYGNNESIIADVDIISGDGQGYCGLFVAYNNENGPFLARDVYIRGFNYGIKSHVLNSATICNIELEDQRVAGIFNWYNDLYVENCISRNTVPAIVNKGYLYLGNAQLLHGSPDTTAIFNDNRMCLRNITSRGYSRAVWNQSDSIQCPTGSTIDEWFSHEPVSLFNSPLTALNLPGKTFPRIPWDDDPADWVNVKDFMAGNTGAEALQNAIDAGKTTVLIPQGFNISINDTVFLRGSVRRLVGTTGSLKGRGPLVFSEGIYPDVCVERLLYCSVDLVHRANRTLSVEASMFRRYIGEGPGDFFLSDVLGSLWMKNPDQTVYARHFNSEGQGGLGYNIRVDKGNLRMVGYKSEWPGTKLHVFGGKAEFLGFFAYPNCTDKGLLPLISIRDAEVSISLLHQMNCCSPMAFYSVVVQETWDNETRKLLHFAPDSAYRRPVFTHFNAHTREVNAPIVTKPEANVGQHNGFPRINAQCGVHDWSFSVEINQPGMCRMSLIDAAGRVYAQENTDFFQKAGKGKSWIVSRSIVEGGVRFLLVATETGSYCYPIGNFGK